MPKAGMIQQEDYKRGCQHSPISIYLNDPELARLAAEVFENSDIPAIQRPRYIFKQYMKLAE